MEFYLDGAVNRTRLEPFYAHSRPGLIALDFRLWVAAYEASRAGIDTGG